MIDCQVLYLDQEMPRLRMDERGDWVDVRASRVVVNGVGCAWGNYPGMAKDELGMRIMPGWTVIIQLGFAMRFPATYEAHMLARSSLFKRSGLILQHGMGLIDHTYCGPDDEWILPCVALREGILRKYERVAQFRLIPRMLPLNFQEVDSLDAKSRGGYGSTGDVEYEKAKCHVVLMEDDGYQD